MMALFMNVFILLKPPHLERKVSDALEGCKLKGRTSKPSVGWDGRSGVRHFSQHLKHAQKVLLP